MAPPKREAPCAVRAVPRAPLHGKHLPSPFLGSAMQDRARSGTAGCRMPGKPWLGRSNPGQKEAGSAVSTQPRRWSFPGRDPSRGRFPGASQPSGEQDRLPRLGRSPGGTFGAAGPGPAVSCC